MVPSIRRVRQTTGAKTRLSPMAMFWHSCRCLEKVLDSTRFICRGLVRVFLPTALPHLERRVLRPSRSGMRKLAPTMPLNLGSNNQPHEIVELNCNGAGSGRNAPTERGLHIRGSIGRGAMVITDEHTFVLNSCSQNASVAGES